LYKMRSFVVDSNFIMSQVHLDICLNFDQVLEAARQLTPQEKTKLSALILVDEYQIPITTQNEVLARIEASKKNPQVLLDWDEVNKQLDL
jgi:hypothetical protein